MKEKLDSNVGLFSFWVCGALFLRTVSVFNAVYP
jgi:hypothetical protein